MAADRGPRRLAAWLVAQCVAHSQPTLKRAHVGDMLPSARALLRSQAGPHAGAWLSPFPADSATTLSTKAMQLALRRRLRLPPPLRPNRCGPSPGCGGLVDVFGDHALACPCTGLLAPRAKIVERAVGESCPRGGWGSRWPGGPTTAALRHHCSRRCAKRQTPS